MSNRTIPWWGFTAAITVYVIAHFVSLIWENPLFLGILSISGIAGLAFALILLSARAVILPAFLIILAVGISFTDPQIGLAQLIWEGARGMRSLIPMVMIIPIVGWVLKQENYVEDTILLLKKRLTNGKAFYFVQMFITQIISFFLLFGSIPVVYQIVQSFFAKQDTYAWKVFKSTAALRGFALTPIWVISIPSFAYAVETLNASLTLTLLQGFVFAMVGILLSVLLLHLYEKKQGVSFSKEIGRAIQEAEGKANGGGSRYRNPVEFAVLFVSLLALTLLVNALVPVGLLTVIPLVVAVWAVSYFIVKRKVPVFLQEGKLYFTKGVATKSQETGLLFSAGLLIVAMNETGLSVDLMQSLYDFTEHVLGLNFLWVLPLIVLALGFVGIGPLTVAVLIAGVVKSIHLPYPPEVIVLAMTLGSALSIMLSPLIIPVILFSGINRLSTFENSIKFNWKFGVLFYFVVEVYLQMW